MQFGFAQFGEHFTVAPRADETLVTRSPFSTPKVGGL